MKKIIIIFAIFIFVFVFVLILLINNKKSSTSPAPPGNFTDIKPGDTTRTSVEKGLGSPVLSEKIEGGSISKYRSDNTYWTNDIYYQDEVVRLTKSKILPPKDTSLSRKVAMISEKTTPLYGEESHVGIVLYVYPKTGVAYLANKEQNVVYEEWKFNKTDISSFLRLPEVKEYSIMKAGGKPDF